MRKRAPPFSLQMKGCTHRFLPVGEKKHNNGHLFDTDTRLLNKPLNLTSGEAKLMSHGRVRISERFRLARGVTQVALLGWLWLSIHCPCTFLEFAFRLTH